MFIVIEKMNTETQLYDKRFQCVPVQSSDPLIWSAQAFWDTQTHRFKHTHTREVRSETACLIEVLLNVSQQRHCFLYSTF